MASRLAFFGPVPSDQVTLYAASADLGIAPIENVCLSYYYCSPNKLFEYLLAGLPVIASDFPEMRHIIDKYGDDFKKFNSIFTMGRELSNFTKFAEKNDVRLIDTDFVKDKEYIMQRLKAYVARELWGNNGWYSVILDEDSQFQTAIKLVNNPILKDEEE